ncbi:unnamed protein product [Oncorhynchus mykiss]|uniref:DBB domain-containing protein n=1 Tax=Oncorhynchus mykiss TaxID=8022 RepID=A0A060XRK4_ONCMY|nr:unnamed protein product [Oncorhynchus mykiss]
MLGSRWSFSPVLSAVFILLKDTVASKDAEVEFRGSKRRMRVKPVHWNEHILCVNTAAGSVGVTLYCGDAEGPSAVLQHHGGDLSPPDQTLWTSCARYAQAIAAQET